MADTAGVYRIPADLLAHTFAVLRSCGAGARECQVLWVSPWADPQTIRAVVHPQHRAHRDGFVLGSAWLNTFWRDLARTASGIRVQVHTHADHAFHSDVDDAYPIIHSVGFLSLVIPNFAQGPAGFTGAYLAMIQPDGRWKEVAVESHLELLP